MDLREKCGQILYLVTAQLEQDLHNVGVIHSPGLDLLASWRNAEEALSEVERVVGLVGGDAGDGKRGGDLR